MENNWIDKYFNENMNRNLDNLNNTEFNKENLVKLLEQNKIKRNTGKCIDYSKCKRIMINYFQYNAKEPINSNDYDKGIDIIRKYLNY